MERQTMVQRDTTQKTKDWETQAPLKYGALENSASLKVPTCYFRLFWRKGFITKKLKMSTSW